MYWIVRFADDDGALSYSHSRFCPEASNLRQRGAHAARLSKQCPETSFCFRRYAGTMVTQFIRNFEGWTQ
jgi:hypothetical protein